MDSDTKKLLDWQKRVVETMSENAGGGDPFAYIRQTKWDKMKAEAVEMQERLQPRRWTVYVYEGKNGRVYSRTEAEPIPDPGNWNLRGIGVVVEGEG